MEAFMKTARTQITEPRTALAAVPNTVDAGDAW